MRTAEFTFELPCKDIDERNQIMDDLCILLEQYNYKIQSNLSSDINYELSNIN